MKKVIINLLGALILGLSGCFKPGDNIQGFTDVPAIIGSYSTVLEPVLVTTTGILLAPELSYFPEFNHGDAVLAYFSINFDKQPLQEYTTVSDLQVYRINTAVPVATTGGQSTGDFDSPIPYMDSYCSIIEYYDRIVYFLIFGQNANIEDVFDYEMTYDPDYTEEIPSVYIRVKRTGSNPPPKERIVPVMQSFDMTQYIIDLKHTDKKMFNIKYNKSGEDGEEDLDRKSVV